MKTRSKLSATAIILLLALGGLLAIESFQNLISGANVGALNFTISEVHTLVTLISPDDGAGIPGGNITFNYNVTGIVTLTNCSLMLDGAFISTAASPARNITLNFTRRMVGGDYAWWITCVNTLNVRFNSSIRGFTITEAAAPAVLRTGNQPANPVTEIINTIIVGEIKANELKTIQIGDEKSSVESLAVRLLRFVSDVKITVGTLFDLPAGIESPPQGNVYKYININAPKLENESIISLAEINFKVTKAWLDANEADKNSVSLARYKSATGWQIFMTKRPPDDKFWSNEWHIPGTIVRQNEKIRNAYKRLLSGEIPSSGRVFGKLEFVGKCELLKGEGKNRCRRGHEIGLLHMVEFNGDELKGGKFFPISKLPANTISHHTLVAMVRRFLGA